MEYVMASDYIGPVLRVLIDDIVESLVASNPARRPGRIIHINPGLAPAFDDCCDGQLYSRVASVQPIVDPRAIGAVPCGITGFVATCAIGLVRCAATVDSQGNAPRVPAIEADGQEMLDDLATIQEVLLCSGLIRSLVSWEPIPELGGCHGGEYVFTLRLETCACPPPVAP